MDGITACSVKMCLKMQKPVKSYLTEVVLKPLFFIFNYSSVKFSTFIQ